MKASYSRLVEAVAARFSSRSELNQALQRLLALGAERFLDDIFEARKALGTEDPLSGEGQGRRQAPLPFASDPANQVVNLLRRESALPTNEAARLLLDAIGSPAISEKVRLPDQRKISFRDWVVQLAKLVPPAELLRAATVIRNSRLHSQDQDWPLKQPAPKR